MTAEKILSNELSLAHCHIKLDGKQASEAFMNDLMLVEVEQSLYLPPMFTIRLHNHNLGWFETREFKIGSAIEILMGQDRNNLTAIIKEAEVTALELDASPLGMPTVTLRGYSKLHRLHRERKIRSFAQVSDSDLVSRIAGEGGLSADAVDTGQVYDYIFQNNETNYEFLQRRARRIGLELFTEDNKLKLRKPALSEASSAEVKWGESLTHFVSRITAQGQVDAVTVRGWDPKSKKEIVGQAASSTHHPTIGASTEGGAVAKKAFGGAAKMYSVYHSVVDQTEANKIAQAIYDDMSGRYIQIEGQCLGEARIKVGKPLKVGGIGTNNSGTYYVTSCVHHYSLRGYTTSFEANGRQSHTMAELVGPSAERSGGERVFGLVIGVVSNNKDAEGKMNRVKVKFPSLGDNVESNWARVITPMTGNGYGAQYLPEINDEVLVAFENGDINYPYVLGGVWNGKDAVVKDSGTIVGSDGKVNERIFKTRTGHIVTFNDSEDAPSITITDKTTKNTIKFDSKQNVITVHSDKDIVLEAPNGLIQLTAKNIELKATQDIKAEATQNISLKATQNVQAEATQNISLKATQDIKAEASMNFEAKANMNANIKGAVAANLSGLTTSVKGDTNASLEGGAMAQVKGAIVKIN